LFYNVHIAPWVQLTGDLQIIRPVRPAADTAIVPGVRVKLVF
jgi:carbohydrate-selective porin OprB